jgi:hypothetical protein
MKFSVEYEYNTGDATLALSDPTNIYCTAVHCAVHQFGPDS